MKRLRTLAHGCAVLYVFLWIGGMISYALEGGPPDALASAVVLLYAPPGARLPLVLAGLIGYAAEVPGTHLGVPFGHYIYTEVLFPHLFSVPLVLVCAWLILIAYVWDMLRPLGWPRIAAALAGAAWMTAIDGVIDPLAGGPLNYWEWEGTGPYHGIPWTNFLGWFAVSFVIFLAIPAPDRANPAARLVGCSVIVFFGVIAAAEALAGPITVAALLAALHGVWIYAERRCSRPPRAYSSKYSSDGSNGG